MKAYIIRDSATWATLVAPALSGSQDYEDAHHDRDPFSATETRTDYTVYGGLLCLTWNRHDGSGSQFQEVCTGRGGTIPIVEGADVAAAIQSAMKVRFGYLPEIRMG